MRCRFWEPKLVNKINHILKQNVLFCKMIYVIWKVKIQVRKYADKKCWNKLENILDISIYWFFHCGKLCNFQTVKDSTFVFRKLRADLLMCYCKFFKTAVQKRLVPCEQIVCLAIIKDLVALELYLLHEKKVL